MAFRVREKSAALVPVLLLAVAGCSAPPAASPADTGAAAGGSGKAQAAEAKGILVAHIPSSSSAEVDGIDPASGASHIIASFTSPDSSVWIDPGIVGSTFGAAPMRRAMFSPDLHRVTAVKKLSDGNHVGWLDTTGKFTDVTASSSASSSGFTTVTADDTPMFGADGTFYFARREAGGNTEGQPTIMKVPAGSTGPATEVKRLTYNEGVAYFVNPDGTLVGVPAAGGTFQENGGGVGGYVVEDWLSPTEYLAVGPGKNAVYRVMGKPRAQADLLDSPTSGTALIPTTNRTVYDPVASPDKARVAFLSTAPGSTAVEVYTVGSAGGGSPQKVPGPAVDGKDELIGWN